MRPMTIEDFLKYVNAEAHVSENGSLYICPASVSSAYRDANGNCKVHRLKCADCRKEFWSKEV